MIEHKLIFRDTSLKNWVYLIEGILGSTNDDVGYEMVFRRFPFD
jgi:hypothetical protein